MELAGRQVGIIDPIDAGVGFEELGYGKGILRVALHTEMKRFGALQQQEGIERRERRAGVAQTLHPGLENERQWSKRFRVGNSVVRGIGFHEVRETPLTIRTEVPGTPDQAAVARAPPANKLGRRIDDNIGSPLDGT